MRRESDVDLARETEVRQMLSTAWGLNVVKLEDEDDWSPVDSTLWTLGPDPVLVGVVEIKARPDIHYGQYDSLFFSDDKWAKLVIKEMEWLVPGYMVWFLPSDNNKLLYTHAMNTDRAGLVWPDGRTDRGDKNDIEDMIHLPWSVPWAVRYGRRPTIIGRHIAMLEGRLT